jgi:AcrR family transcriptional regulator
MTRPSPEPPSGEATIARPVGRPRVDRSEAPSRIAILDAAESLFAEHGFDATPTRKIAKRANVTTGLVFYYFPTKESLLKALIEERSVLPRIMELLPESDGGGDFRRALETTGRDLYDLIHRSHDIVRIVTSEVPHHPYIQRHWEDMLESVLDQLTVYMADASDGTVPMGQAAPLARVFFSTIAFHAIFDPDHDRDTLVDELLAAVALG